MTKCTPETSEPAQQGSPLQRRKVPAIIDVSMTKAPGGIISLSEASVETLTQVAYLVLLFHPKCWE